METQLYYFIGAESEIGTRKLEKYGSEIKLTDAEALNALDGGVQLLPAKDWHFTKEEVKQYPFPKFRERAPAEFKARHIAALKNAARHLRTLKTAFLLKTIAEAKPGALDSWADPERTSMWQRSMTLTAAEHPEVAAYLKALKDREAKEAEEAEREAELLRKASIEPPEAEAPESEPVKPAVAPPAPAPPAKPTVPPAAHPAMKPTEEKSNGVL